MGAAPRPHPCSRATGTLFPVGGTSGCTVTQYCPGDVVTRDQMAIVSGRAMLPPGAALPVIWDEEEERRWSAIVVAVRDSSLYRELCSSYIVGTELPLLRVRDGTAGEERADLVVRPPGPSGELRVIDYKTGDRDRSLEAAYFVQLREYRDILSGAWRVPVRGTLWYVESGASIEVT